MAPRPTWKGYLKLSLVSCAVAMYTATSTSSRIRLHIINRETGNRIRNQAIDSETGDVVDTENKVKGYELDNGKYVLLEEDELDEVALESTHTLEIETFVPRDEVDEIYLDESFYIVPDGEAAYEDMLELAEHILKQKKGHFDPDKFEDRYEDALSALIKAKRAGKEPPAAPEHKPSNVINLMDALRRSVGEKGSKSRGHARGKSSGRRTSAKKKTAKHKRLKKAS